MVNAIDLLTLTRFQHNGCSHMLKISFKILLNSREPGRPYNVLHLPTSIRSIKVQNFSVL